MGSIPKSITYLETIMDSPSMKNKILKASSPKDDLPTNTLMRSLIMDANAKHPFYVLDLGVLANLMHRWDDSLPEIRPFYAVKCNPDPRLLAALATLGSGFDCATRAEIEAVLALGVAPDRIIFANPCKLESDIKFAAAAGVNLTTFDSESELKKLQDLHPQCSLLLRIKPPVSGGAMRDLGPKYGALPEEVVPLLRSARDSRLPVVGVSFHVGSAATNARAYAAAIAASKEVFDAAEELGMPPMKVLDVGGGFFDVGEVFEEAASAINVAVLEHFGEELSGVSLMAEPGRFFAESAFTLAARIVGKRVRGVKREYWLNDGIYGSFMGCVVLECGNGNLTCMPLAFHACRTKTTAELSSFDDCWDYESTVFGPTCDSLDVVLNGYRLPELEVGDWLVFPRMGAYSSAFRSNFNGMNTTPYSTFVAATYG